MVLDKPIPPTPIYSLKSYRFKDIGPNGYDLPEGLRMTAFGGAVNEPTDFKLLLRVLWHITQMR